MSERAIAEKISVLIADDHQLIRDALAILLLSQGRFTVTTVSSFDAALSELACKGRIDVVLLDVVMPGMRGLNSVEQTVKLNPGGAVVLFSGNVAADFIQQALDFGARGYIPKTLPLKSLATAIELIASGQVFVPFILEAEPADPQQVDSDRLTQKELEVLRLVSDGLTNKEIAWRLGMAEVTIKMRMRSVCAKLAAKNRAHASMIGKEKGLI